MPFEPEKITAEHVRHAILRINEENIPLRRIREYELVVDGNAYPPKQIMRMAHEAMNGEHIWRRSGGPPTNDILRALGFEVRSKNNGPDPVLGLINRYKARVRETGLKNEMYKWQLLEAFRGKPDLSAPDFIHELKSIDYRNLIYQMGVAVMHRIVEKKPEDYRKCFRDLFDETRPLKERILTFTEETLRLYRETGEQVLAHHHDERTCATLLTYHNPDRYALYKNSFYQKYCKLIDEKTRKKGEKYLHYLELLDDLITDYIVPDEELLKLVQESLPAEVYQDPSHRLLAQDILYQMLDLQDSKSKNYWRIGTSNGEKSYWEVMLNNDYVSIGWSDLGDLSEAEVSSKKDVEELLKSRGYYPEDKNVLTRKAGEIFDLFSSIKVGDVVVAQHGPRVLGIGIVTDEYAFEDEQAFSHTRPVNWKVVNPPEFTSEEGPQTSVFPIKNPSKIAEIEQLLQTSEPPNIVESASKNIILYGPPGTGKTYGTIDLAVKLAEGTSIDDHESNKKTFNQLRKEGRVEFVTFHQNYSYEDFMVGITPDTTAGTLRFDKKEGVFKKICDLARKNWAAAEHRGDVAVDFDAVFNSFFGKLIKEEVDYIEIPMKSAGYTFKITKIDTDDGRIKFTKQSGGTGHDLVMKNVKGIYEGTINYNEDGLGVYYYPLVNRLRDHAKSIGLQMRGQEVLKNYVLIIDEINRANISKVFGELITLLEDDKRLGATNELRARLPNGEEFGVPPNLYLIGTMNTADRSIALIDIALRRRFEFIGKYPDYGKIKDITKNTLLRKINDAIFNEKKSADYLIGHAYFMGNDPAEITIKNKVIPLLMEYFSGRIDTVKKIFAETNVSVEFNTSSYSWDINIKKNAAPV
jgi:5-methylcytosine-specific restriction protein B